MRNFPKHINTKQDIMNLLKTHPEKIKAYLQNCIDGYRNFVPVSSHENEAECIEDEMHDYVATEEEGVAKYIQREYKVVPGNSLDRLGITPEEATSLIN